jgi:hypothetical protein
MYVAVGYIYDETTAALLASVNAAVQFYETPLKYSWLLSIPLMAL